MVLPSRLASGQASRSVRWPLRHYVRKHAGTNLGLLIFRIALARVFWITVLLPRRQRATRNPGHFHAAQGINPSGLPCRMRLLEKDICRCIHDALQLFRLVSRRGSHILQPACISISWRRHTARSTAAASHPQASCRMTRSTRTMHVSRLGIRTAGIGWKPHVVWLHP
jgi:hypothetical protein